MAKILILLFLLIALASIAAFVLFTNEPGSQEPTSSVQDTGGLFGESFALLSPSSAEIGGADIVERALGTVEVRVALADDSLTPRPAHLHKGSCAQLGAIVFPLDDIVEGASKTTLEVSGEELRAQLPLVLNVHESADALAVSIACGEVPLEQ